MKNENTLMKKVFYDNTVIIMISLFVVFVVMCYMICRWQMGIFTQERILAAEKYSVRVSTAISDGVQKAKNIMTWPYFIDSLNIESVSNYDKLERSNNITRFINNMINDNNASIYIYTENPNVFQNKYIHSVHRLSNYDNIEAALAENENFIWDKDVYGENEGNKYIKFYIGDALYGNYILEYRVFIPQTETPYDMSVINSEKKREKNEIRSSINEYFSVVLYMDGNVLKDEIERIVITFIFFAILFIFIVVIINHKIIKETFRGMGEFISGLKDNDLIPKKAQIPISEKDPDEIMVMKRALNELLQTVKEVTQRQNIIENEKKELEIYMLRKQIDPHMLYNSLTVFKLDAFKKNDEKTMRLVDNMIEYYRAVLNKGNSLVKIKDEISTIKKFLDIYASVNNQTVDFYYEISDSIADYKIPAMMIHTFAENSVVHGFCGMLEICRIVILCSDLGDSIRITIEDNGCGIDPEKLEQLNEGNGRGYGIRNTLMRIKTMFGDDAKVHFESEPNKRTVVNIHFKKILLKETMKYGA